MSLYTELKPIHSYLTHIRKLDTYIVFDLNFPTTWKVLKKFISEDKFVNNGIHDNLLHLSIVSEFDESEINKTQENILGIISYNLEREEKERLLESKISELRTIFEKEPLDNLKILKFDLETPVTIEDGKHKPNRKGNQLPTVIED